MTSSELKIGSTVDAFQWIHRDRLISYQEMMRRYEFIWSFFKEVADEHGLHCPWTWFGAEKIATKHRYTKYKGTRYLEPLGPTTYVDQEILNGAYLLHLAASTDNLAYTANWTKVAERFFMVDKKVPQALNSPRQIRLGVICEKWRVIEPRPHKRLTLPK